MKKHSDETITGDADSKPPESTGMEDQIQATPATQDLGATDILKLLAREAQTASNNSVAVRSLLSCSSGNEDAPSFSDLSGKLVKAVTSAHIEAASNGDLPFSTLYRLAGSRLGEELADRSKRPKAISEILASQIRDNALACEMLNSSLYSMKQEDISKSLAQGKGPLQNTINLRHSCEKSVHYAVEVMNALDESLYPQVTLKRSSSVKISMRKAGRQKVTLDGSTVQEQKAR